MPKQLIYIFALFLFFGMTSENLLAQQPQYQRQFEDGFQKRYSGNRFDYEGTREIKKNRTFRDAEPAEYESGSPDIKEDNNRTDFIFSSGIFQWIFIGILIVAVGYLVYILMNEGGQSLFLSGRNRKLSTNKGTDVKAIQDTDVHTLIAQAENTNDFRLAIRYLHLQVLKTLSLKRLIKLEDDKTDSEYLGELQQTKHKTAFAQTSYVYNYVWFGEFPLDANQYHKAKSNFVSLLKSIAKWKRNTS